MEKCLSASNGNSTTNTAPEHFGQMALDITNNTNIYV